jgi:hypothetical protein
VALRNGETWTTVSEFDGSQDTLYLGLILGQSASGSPARVKVKVTRQGP